MSDTTILVKNMVCQRCIFAVEDILKKVGIAYNDVIFGEIELLVYGQHTLSEIAAALEYSGVAHQSTQFKK